MRIQIINKKNNFDTKYEKLIINKAIRSRLNCVDNFKFKTIFMLLSLLASESY